MSESLQILIIAASLLIGCVTIIFASRISRKYRLPYLSTYFYFIVFLYVFTVYGMIGSTIFEGVLTSHDISHHTVSNIRLLFIFLGVPFIILSWYMFLRFCLELTGRSLSNLFNLVFFIIQSLLLLAYIYFLIRIFRFGDNLYELVMKLLVITYSVVTVVVSLAGMITILLHTAGEYNRTIRRSYRILGYMYLGFFLIQAVLLNFSQPFPIVSVVFVFVLLGYHILPILFMNIFLDKNYVPPETTRSFESQLDAFVSRYGISKRETEIIEQIFNGKSNQEISEALFISLQTVKDHIHRIYLKTGVRNRVQLTNLIRTDNS